MRHLNRITKSILTLLIGWIAMSTSATATEWANLTPYQKHLVTFVLPASSPEVWDAEEVQIFLRKHGTRSGIYHVVGMLYRNEGADRKNAQLVIKDLLKLQYNAPDENIHGMWRTGVGRDRRDQNWREFIAMGLIVAREYFGKALDPALIRDIDASLIRAAEGAAKRDVSPGYTNIALMSAFLLDYTGHIASNPAFQEQGKTKAKNILDLFSQHNTFTEFNSPTYYGTNLLALGIWRELAKSPELRDWAQQIEAVFWNDIAQFYHADLKNMCGPYVRGYGMDMTEYAALVGICIAMGLDGPEHAPLPNTRDRPFEWAYTPLYALLNVQPPEHLRPEFKTFSKPRELLRHIPHRNRVFQAQALLEPTWMMGAATGMRRRWEQHCPGTVHWKVGDQLGWLLVHGENAAEVKIIDRKMHIYLTQTDPEYPLRILIQVPGANMAQIADNTWNLPGMTFNVQTPLSSPTVQIKTEKNFGDVLEIAFPVSDATPTDTPALVLSPVKTPQK